MWAAVGIPVSLFGIISTALAWIYYSKAQRDLEVSTDTLKWLSLPSWQYDNRDLWDEGKLELARPEGGRHHGFQAPCCRSLLEESVSS